jgi:site-specific recombinase XerD
MDKFLALAQVLDALQIEGVSRLTIKVYRKGTNRFFRFVKKTDIEQVTAEDFRAWLKDLEDNGICRNAMRGYVSHF